MRGPGALYDASVPAQTFETIEETITIPIELEEIVDADAAKVLETNPQPNIPLFEEFSRNIAKSVNRVNSMGGGVKSRQIGNPF